MPIYKFLPKLAAGLLIFTLAACFPVKSKAPPVRSLPRLAPQLSPQQILTSLKRQAKQIKSYRALARLRIESWGEQKDLKAILVLDAPSSLRLEFLSFLGQPFQFVVCHRGRFWFYSPSQQQVMTGAATRFNLYRLLGVNMQLEEIINLLSARVSVVPASGAVLIQYLAGESKYLLTINDPESGQEQILWLDAGSLKPHRLVTRQQQQVNLRVSWEEYQAMGSLLFPTKITIQRPLDDTLIQVSYSEYSLNQDFPEETFSLDIPAHTEWVKLPEAG